MFVTVVIAPNNDNGSCLSSSLFQKLHCCVFTRFCPVQIYRQTSFGGLKNETHNIDIKKKIRKYEKNISNKKEIG